ncbi:MAG TPA: secretin N-terminal domain-containing protein, partial [Phycisphaerales bacterium]|nr:secretin N-terminal domain-containing protein [Phycisphaerales bacterium]
MRIPIAALALMSGTVLAQDPPATAPASQPAAAAPSAPVAEQPAATQPATAQAPPAVPAAPAAPLDIRFNFKGATYRQVIDFFARSTGLPVVWESDVPEGTLDYVSPRGYDMPEALRILNIILQSKGVMLRVDGNMLYLQKLTEMAKENIPTFTGTLPESVTDDQIVTVVMPLKIALAKNLAEKLGAMVNAAYGSVAAMEQQNSLMITETAGQVRRLLAIVTQLDQADPEGQVEIFAIKHAKAVELMTPLKALLSQRVEKYVINQEGRQVKLEEDQMPGLTITADERTNSVIAKGVQAKIDGLREAIKLLDVPASDAASAGRTLWSATLSIISAQDAANRLRQLYERGGGAGGGADPNAPPRNPNQPPRPTIIALDEMSKVVMLGTEAQIVEAKALIRELEGEPAATQQASNEQSGAAVIELQRANAQAVVTAVQSMLTRRQAAVMKIAPGPDGKSILVTGLPGDVASVRALAQALDRQAPADKQVRQLRIAAGDPVKIVDQARKLFDEQSAALDETSRTISVEVDPDARVVTAVGSARAVEQFTTTLRMIEGNVTVAREARRITLTSVLPSEIAGPLNTLAQPLLQPSDGSQYVAPTFTPVDQLNTLVITATPEQLAVLESLAASLDSKEAAVGAGMPPLRILQLKIADAGSVASALMNQYNQRTASERKAKPVNIAADPVTNALLVAAHPDLLGDIQKMVEELNTVERTDLEGREIRIFPLKVARAEQLARTIDEMYPAPPPPLDARGRPLPQLAKPREVVVRADAQTNSLIVDAPVQRMAGFQQLVDQLDRAQLSVETQVRTYRVEHANLESIAQTLRQLAASNSLGSGGAADQRTPTNIATEPVSKALVVSGPAEIFARVETVLKDLDVQRAGPATTLRFFTLKNAKAETIAEMLRQVLLTRIAQDLPEAKNEAAALLNVTADRKTNTLILSAPEAIMPVAETLIQQLDSGTASVGDPIVRVKPLTFADAGSVSQSLMAALPSMVSKATGEPVSVKLFAGPGSNAIIMVGLEAELAEVEALIEPLDARPTSDAMDAKTFTLQHADATKISQTVQNLLNDQQETDPRILLERIRASRGQLNLTPKIRVEADARTNSLIVSGPQQALALAETLIKQLDAPDDQSQRVSSVFTPKNSLDINSLAANVKRVMDATRPIGGAATRTTLEIVAEPQSGAIVVIGPEAETQRAMAMLAERDAQALAAPQIDLRLIGLKNAPAEMLAQIVQGLLRDPSRWPADLRAIVRAGVSIAQPSVFPDVAGNRLLISAPAQLMPLAGQLVAELDQERSGDAERSVQVLTLVNADAAQLATSLDAVFAEDPAARKPVIRVDPASNSLLVRGTAEQFHAIEEVVKRVDQAALASGRQMKVVPLDPARGNAADIAAALKKMLQRDGEGGPTVEVMTLEELLNSRGEGAKPQATPASGSQSSAAGVSIQAMLATCVIAMAQDAPPSPQQEPDVTIAVDQATNSLVFLGAPRAVERIIALLKQMQEQLPAAPGKIRSIALPAELDARHIATMISQILQKYAPAAGQPGDLTKRVSVLADGPSNALIVAANDIDFKIVSDLIAAFAKPPEQKFPVRTITLAKAPAESVAQAIQQFYDRRAALQAQTREGGGTGGQPKAAVAVMAIESSNTLLVCANDADFADVQKLVEQFDTAEAAGALTFKVFQLKNARATEIQRTVQNLVNDLLYNQPDAFMYFWPPRPQSSKKDTIAVQADARLNTLIVTGRGDKFDVVEQMIEILDAPPPQGAERIVKLYRPTHAPLSLIADMISSAFNASRQRRP